MNFHTSRGIIIEGTIAEAPSFVQVIATSSLDAREYETTVDPKTGVYKFGPIADTEYIITPVADDYTFVATNDYDFAAKKVPMIRVKTVKGTQVKLINQSGVQ